MPDDPERAREREHERSKERSEHNVAAQAAGQRAARATVDIDDLQSGDFIEKAFSPDLDRENAPDGRAADLEDFLAPELPKHIGMGNISRDEYEEEKQMDKARAMMARMEFSKPGGVGSKATAETRERMGATAEDKPDLTDDRARGLRSGYEARSALRSLSVGARGWRGMTESAMRIRRDDTEDDTSKGRLASALDNIF